MMRPSTSLAFFAAATTSFASLLRFDKDTPGQSFVLTTASGLLADDLTLTGCAAGDHGLCDIAARMTAMEAAHTTLMARVDALEVAPVAPPCDANVLGYFRGDLTTGSSWADVSGRSNNAQVSSPGTVTSAGGVLTFRGGYLDTGITKAELGNDFTIAANVKYGGTRGQTYSAVVGSTDPTGGGTEFFLGKNSGSFSIGMQDGNYNGALAPDNSALFDGSWHTVVFTQNSGSGRVYVDGTLTGGPTTYSQTNSQEKILIGMELEGAGYPWTGDMTSVLLINHGVDAADASRIATQMAGGSDYCSLPVPPVTPTCPSYVLAYYSQHGQGTSFPSGSWQDLSGSSRDATPTGGVSVSSNYLTFDGTGYLDTTITKGTIGSDYTIAAEVKFSGSTGQTYSAVVGSTDPTGGGTEFFFGKNSGDTCIGMQDGNYNGCLASTSSLFDGGWHTVILSQRASVSNVFVDGVHVGGPTTYSQTNSQEKIMIGMEVEGAGYGWTGEMKQVIFLDHGVANSDVLGIHNAMELASGGAAPWCSSV
jgi:hypothetical protein